MLIVEAGRSACAAIALKTSLRTLRLATRSLGGATWWSGGNTNSSDVSHARAKDGTNVDDSMSRHAAMCRLRTPSVESSDRSM